MRFEGLRALAVLAVLAMLTLGMTGCETNSDPDDDSSNETNSVLTNLVGTLKTADLEGVWDLTLVGGTTALSAGLVIDSYGNVTGLSGPADVKGASGSFFVGTDGQSVNGAIRYEASVTNGVMASCNIYLQGAFQSINLVSGSQTYGWTTPVSSGYDTGTFSMSR